MDLFTSNIKSLQNLTLPDICLNPNSGHYSIIKSLPNLEVLKFSMKSEMCNIKNWYELSDNLPGIGLEKICLDVDFQFEYTYFHSDLYNFVLDFPQLEVIKLNIKCSNLVYDLCNIIYLLKFHPKLYKFNGFRYKSLDNKILTTITIYEDLLRDEYNRNNLTLDFIHHYSRALKKYGKIKLKPIRNASIRIDIRKIIEKIKKLGYFSDLELFNNFKIPMCVFCYFCHYNK